MDSQPISLHPKREERDGIVDIGKPNVPKKYRFLKCPGILSGQKNDRTFLEVQAGGTAA